MHANERLFRNWQLLEQNKIQKKDSHHEKALKNLKQEIREGKYEVFLQPKVRCLDGKISGAEALIRYYDKGGKIVRPDSFIPFFEAEGLIAEIDLFVFEEVNKILQSWLEQNKLMFPISLNFSRETMMNEVLFEQIETIQKKYNVPRNYLEIEITETVGTIDEDLLIRIGKKISNLGFGLTLDDFGARYSNLSILTSLPFTVLKLDKTLVRDIFFNPRTKIVVQSFLTTCKNLEISSIAEGVESQDQFDILKGMGCDSIQGYLINKPIPVKEFEKKYLIS
jgi:EAL domain-containing protein (putative c-di-GMP-specific phosphodiesterase class I)